MMRSYRTYRFRVDSKDPIIAKLRALREEKKETYSSVCEKSGVSTSTLYNWDSGNTRRPQFATANAIAMALGHELRLMPKNEASRVAGRARTIAESGLNARPH